MAYPLILPALEADAGEPQFQGRPELHNKFEAILCNKKTKDGLGMNSFHYDCLALQGLGECHPPQKKISQNDLYKPIKYPKQTVVSYNYA